MSYSLLRVSSKSRYAAAAGNWHEKQLERDESFSQQKRTRSKYLFDARSLKITSTRKQLTSFMWDEQNKKGIRLSILTYCDIFCHSVLGGGNFRTLLRHSQPSRKSKPKFTSVQTSVWPTLLRRAQGATPPSPKLPLFTCVRREKKSGKIFCATRYYFALSLSARYFYTLYAFFTSHQDVFFSWSKTNLATTSARRFKSIISGLWDVKSNLLFMLANLLSHISTPAIKAFYLFLNAGARR